MKWPEVEIGQLCLPAEQADPRDKPDEPFEYIDISSIDKDLKIINQTQSILGSEAPSRARKIVRKGDVLVSTVRPNLNAVAVVPESLDQQIASTGFFVLRPNTERAVGKYLFYRALTSEFIGFLTARMRGANYPAVTDAIVRQAPIPWPPVREQHRIVEILDQADALRKKRAEADVKAARILPALFYKMFGDPASLVAGKSVKPLGELVDVVSGATPSKQVNEYWQGDIPWISPKDMKRDYIHSSSDHISSTAARFQPETHLPRGDSHCRAWDDSGTYCSNSYCLETSYDQSRYKGTYTERQTAILCLPSWNT